MMGVYGIDCGMVSQVHTYLQTHPVVYIKYVQLLYVTHTSIKWFKNVFVLLSLFCYATCQNIITSFSDLNFLNVAYPDLFCGWKLE